MIPSFILRVKFEAELLNHYEEINNTKIKKKWALKPRDSKSLYEKAKEELNLWVRLDEL